MAMTHLAKGIKALGRMAYRLSEQEKSILYAPKTWPFWRNNIMLFCVDNVLGHCLESLYCKVMDKCFGIIDDSYAVKFDP